VIAGVQGQVELGEDAADVGLDRLAAEVFPTAAGIALWAVAAGIGLLLRRGATAPTPRVA